MLRLRTLARAFSVASFVLGGAACSTVLGDFTVDGGAPPGEDGGVDATTDAPLADADAAPAHDAGEGATPGVTLTVGASRVRVVRGSLARVDVHLRRDVISGAGTVRVSGLPASVTADALILVDGASDGVLVLRADATAALGARATLTISVTVGALTSSVPVDLLVQDPPGTLDTTFGAAGRVSLPVLYGVGNEGLAVQPDGRILLCGSAVSSSGYNVVVARLSPAGALDPTFASNGVLATNAPNDVIDSCSSVRTLPDGSIVVTGFTLLPIASQAHAFMALKTTPAGVPDTTFGQRGFAVVPVGTDDAKGTTLAIQRDGKLVLGGFGGPNPALLRLLPDGRADTTFGPSANGLVLQSFPNAGSFSGVVLRSDGSILASDAFASSLLVFRYSPLGILDASYGTAGHATSPAASQSTIGAQIAIQPDDKVVLAGAVNSSGSTLAELARFTDQGQIDPTFGGGGVRTTSLGGASSANAVTRAEDGSLVLAASVPTSTAGATFGAARFTADGVLDTTFGGKGYVSTVVGKSTSSAVAVAVDADGRVLVAGAASNGTRNEGVLVRYWP